MVGAHVSIRAVTRRRAVLLLWLLLMAWTSALYLRAALEPPPGRVFVGAFHWIDDVYNYVSYVQQADDGAFLFRNKLAAARGARAELVNLEWWVVAAGVSASSGRRPLPGLPAASRAWLTLAPRRRGGALAARRVGVPDTHRLAALLLVLLGGGLGGLLFELTDLPARRCLDLAVAVFPFFEILANPHFVAGTALLVWALWCLLRRCPARRGAAPRRRPRDGAGPGAALRPRPPRGRSGPSVSWSWSPRAAGRVGAPLLPASSRCSRTTLALPRQRAVRVVPPGRRFPALGRPRPRPRPALASLASRRGGGATARARGPPHLWAWAAIAGAIVAAAARRLLASAARRRRSAPARPWRGRADAIRARADSPARPGPQLERGGGHPGRAGRRSELVRPAREDGRRRGAARSLRARGPRSRAPRRGAVRGGLSRCHALVAHPATPDYEARLSEARAFYATWSPGERSDWLDRHGVTHLVLPGDAGPGPRGGSARARRSGRWHGWAGPGLSRARAIYARPRLGPALRC